ncbi:uncharacterized protein LOC110248466 [Exaiptasia diaphana]|uniref:Uncharacterized protein n=1 Tax=Exaiptasia diaphana TaxID=2652724 RepID=A0A913XVX9_EXADI|nr:uncharacterized protein LOC110248466 [Exaiptasia diaphana]
MMRTSLVVLSLPFLLGIFKSTEGVSGGVGSPSNGQLKTFPNNASRLCVVLQWTSICDSKVTICRTTLKLTTKRKNVKSSITKTSFIPHTAADNRTKYQCVYDASKESSSCCAEIVKGLMAQDAIGTTLSTEDGIEFEAKNCLNYSGNCAVGKPFSFVAPWKNSCLLSKPCGHYSQRCLATKANEYNCVPASQAGKAETVKY